MSKIVYVIGNVLLWSAAGIGAVWWPSTQPYGIDGWNITAKGIRNRVQCTRIALVQRADVDEVGVNILVGILIRIIILGNTIGGDVREAIRQSLG